mmetsp:Transcript_31045/g.68637  ORF Transcript_31045/g.68637 Transcript_31045/m.68637 type:complete len:601 (-) Transcript_31045:8-1810(-)
MAAREELLDCECGAAEPRKLRADQLGYSLHGRCLLENITCQWVGGSLHAVMGPSGAGKTTLLRALMGDVAGTVTGHISLDGMELSKSDCRKVAAFIPQDDVLQSALSPADLLRFTALLRGVDQSSVQAVMDSMRLTTCAHTCVGDTTDRGISGGERKRCSIGIELLSDPLVLLADEPSTGLDSAMAEDVVKLLAKSAAAGNRIAVATIHQPSWAVLQSFSTVTLLAAGGLAFSGTVDRLCSYFAALAEEPPQYENPIDFYMRLLQVPDKRASLLEAWKQAGEEWQVPSPAVTSETLTTSSHSLSSSAHGLRRSRKVGFAGQFCILLRRAAVEFFKDRSRIFATVFLKMFVGLVVGTIWWKSATHPDNSTIYITESAMFTCIFASIMDTLAATLLHVPGIKAIVHREVMNGLYGFPAWYWSTMATFFVQQAIASFSLATPVYLMAGLRPTSSHFLVFFCDLGALACIGATLGLFVGGFTKDFQGARQAIMPVLIPQIIFSGFVIPYKQLPGWGQYLYYITLFQYGLSIARINQFADVAFDDCPSIAAMAGFCFETGDDYLQESRLSQSLLGRDFALLLALLVVFSIGAYIVMWRVATKPAN